MKTAPIGIFDSGIGGLTVAKQIISLLPNENIIYLGDTARVPYGTRDKKTITQFSLELAKFLLKQKVKVLVVACNTISATSLLEIKKLSPVPVIGVIDTTVQEALEGAGTRVIGVIGTRATINSKAYEKSIKEVNIKAKIISQACPLFVPLAEEGFINHPASKLIAKEYLKLYKNSKIDTLILGCTHYPILAKLIQSTVGKKVKLIDSALPTANALKKLLQEKNLLNNGSKKPQLKFYVTDAPERVYKIANLFFDNKFPGILKKVDIY
jgi:glutamate racemase